MSYTGESLWIEGSPQQISNRNFAKSRWRKSAGLLYSWGMNIEAIVGFLINALKAGPMTGANLGAQLKTAFPSLRTEPGYTTLSQFVLQHASNQIGRTRTPSGGDALFHLISEGPPLPIAGAFGASRAPAAWGVFVKADLPQQLSMRHS